jgi:hypothetical protein
VLYAVVIGALFAVVGIGVIAWAYFAVIANVPAYRMTLQDSSWNVTAVNGVPPASQDAVLHLSANNASTLRLDCGEVWLAWVQDTDSEGVEFAENRVPPACRDHEVVDALLGIETWSIQDDNHITLMGDGAEVSLNRSPASTE